MRKAMITLLLALSCQSAYSENCPDIVSDAHGTFDLRAHIFENGDSALAKAYENLDNLWSRTVMQLTA